MYLRIKTIIIQLLCCTTSWRSSYFPITTLSRSMNVFHDILKEFDHVINYKWTTFYVVDFPAVHWVLQLDCPEDSNTYIHRAGRTARWGLRDSTQTKFWSIFKFDNKFVWWGRGLPGALRHGRLGYSRTGFVHECCTGMCPCQNTKFSVW